MRDNCAVRVITTSTTAHFTYLYLVSLILATADRGPGFQWSMPAACSDIAA
jgi:hypothetical protein